MLRDYLALFILFVSMSFVHFKFCLILIIIPSETLSPSLTSATAPCVKSFLSCIGTSRSLNFHNIACLVRVFSKRLHAFIFVKMLVWNPKLNCAFSLWHSGTRIQQNLRIHPQNKYSAFHRSCYRKLKFSPSKHPTRTCKSVQSYQNLQ